MHQRFEDYPFELCRLSEEDGSGWLITFPDLPGCMSDGESVEEAIENGRDAFKCYMAVITERGDAITQPTPLDHVSIFPRLTLPGDLHARLAARARQEEVSMNTLAVALLAEGLGKRKSA